MLRNDLRQKVVINLTLLKVPRCISSYRTHMLFILPNNVYDISNELGYLIYRDVGSFWSSFLFAYGSQILLSDWMIFFPKTFYSSVLTSFPCLFKSAIRDYLITLASRNCAQAHKYRKNEI